MKILSIENKVVDLTHIPEFLEEDIRFVILDNNNINSPDFYFPSLIMLESFNAPALVMDIMGHTISIPIDNMSANWSILLGCSEGTGMLEIVPVTSLNTRGFEAFVMNPLHGFRPEYAKIEIINIYNDVRWYFPRLKNNQLLAVPLTDRENPPCVYFGKDIGKNNEVIEITKLF